MKLTIHNLRAGFATNSSSSHSVVLLPPDAVGRYADVQPEDEGFGWEWFRLVSPEAKLRYVAAQMFSSWRGEMERRDIAERISAAAPSLRDEIEGFLRGADDYGPFYVDHQSAFGIAGAAYDGEVVDGFVRYFLSPRVVVVGGNDNEEEEVILQHSIPNAEAVSFMSAFKDRARDENILIRRGPGYWVSFDPRSGNKLRFSLDPEEAGMGLVPAVKSDFPELCDVKITDWCDAGCRFCYQSSTKAGRHAKLEDIERIFGMLSSVGTFEVALGGGEPAAHPQFAEILRMAKARGLVPNFTTFTDRWTSNEGIVKAVKECVGGIGVSCMDAKGLRLVRDIAGAVEGSTGGWGTPVVTAQHVFGSVPVDVTLELLRSAFDDRIGVLLLGYKEVGFGKDFRRHDAPDAASYVKVALRCEEAKWAQLSVDTALVDQHPGLLDAIGAVEAMVTSPEGKFSCYIDAVERRMGPSSYVEPSTMSPLPGDRDALIREFLTY